MSKCDVIMVTNLAYTQTRKVACCEWANWACCEWANWAWVKMAWTVLAWSRQDLAWIAFQMPHCRRLRLFAWDTTVVLAVGPFISCKLYVFLLSYSTSALFVIMRSRMLLSTCSYLWMLVDHTFITCYTCGWTPWCALTELTIISTQSCSWRCGAACARSRSSWYLADCCLYKTTLELLLSVLLGKTYCWHLWPFIFDSLLNHVAGGVVLTAPAHALRDI